MPLLDWLRDDVRQLLRDAGPADEAAPSEDEPASEAAAVGTLATLARPRRRCGLTR